MLSAIEHLMHLHPASHFGRCWEHRQHDFAAFGELESRHLYPRHEYETDRSEPTRTIGEVAAAAAMLVVFISVLTAIARFAVDAPNTAQEPAVAISEAAELR
jgi:hypothetical protein